MKLKKLATALGFSSAMLCASANAAIIADVVWIIDTSGSMQGDIDQVKQRITEFDTAMSAANIDVRYGLVRYGGPASLIQDVTTFTDFSRAGGSFALLSADGGATEDGSAAIQTAMTANFRPGAVQNYILVTDEDDDGTANRAALDTALASTQGINELINIIGNSSDDANRYYRNLAPANGGAFFEIADFRNNPGPFFTNFINTKVNEIVVDFCTANPTDPACTNVNVPLPGSLALVGAGLAFLGLRRKKSI